MERQFVDLRVKESEEKMVDIVRKVSKFRWANGHHIWLGRWDNICTEGIVRKVGVMPHHHPNTSTVNQACQASR
jgi:hypothetical protein